MFSCLTMLRVSYAESYRIRQELIAIEKSMLRSKRGQNGSQDCSPKDPDRPGIDSPK